LTVLGQFDSLSDVPRQPSLAYLFRLREPMVKRGFPPADPLLMLVEKAYDSMHRLFVELHYLSCDGVGRPSKEESKPKE
jgi:hypothetical protein